MKSLFSTAFRIGSGLHAPARFLLAALALGAVPASAQTTRQPAPAVAPATDADTVNKLIWSTIAAVDHGNVTGNYSVLRDLGAPEFQANNNAASLAGVFQAVRTQRVDLSNTLLVAPVLDFAPTIVQGGLLRVRGRFALRPNAIAFDLLFANNGGRWRLFGIAVVPLAMPTNQPAQRR